MRNPIQADAKSNNLFKSLSGKVRAACAATALSLLGATSAFAVPVTYTIQTDMTGVLNGAAVSGPLTITATADTDNMQVDDTYAWYDNLSVVFTLAGYGSFSGSPSHFSMSANGPWLDFQMVSTIDPWNTYGIHFENAGADGYALQSLASAGPMTFDTTANYAGDLETEAGMFRIGSASNLTFQATLASASAVPEPGSLSLFLGAGLLLAARRRKQAKEIS